MTWQRLVVTAVCLLGSAACSSGDDGAAEPEAPSATADTADDDSTDVDDATDAPATVTPSTAAAPSPTDAPVTAPVASPPEVPPITTDDGIAAPEGDEPTVLGPLGSTEIELDTGSGTVQIGSGEIPSVIPASFPVPADLAVQIASAVDGSAGYSGVSQLAFDAVVDLHRNGLSAAGFEFDEVRFSADSLAVIAFEGPEGTGEVAISAPAPGGGTSVIVTFER